MNELAKIAQESGLPTTQSELLLGIFQEFLGITAKWEEKAKDIKVTDESQTDMMLLAREGRKEMQQLRLKLDRAHQEQKKIPLLYGRAVDGMRNVIKVPIVQLETYLKEQEDFVVNKAKAEAQAKREKADKLLAEQEAAEEKALQDQIEKDRLAKEKELADAKEKERLAEIERDKAIAKQLKIEESAQIAREVHQREIEQKQRENFEREEKIWVENERIAKEAEEKRLDAEKLANEAMAAVEEQNRIEREKMEAEKKELEKQILEKERVEREEKVKEEHEDGPAPGKLETLYLKSKCPKCGHVFGPDLKLS